MNKIIICGIGVGAIVLIIGVIYLPGFIGATLFYADRDKRTAIADEFVENRDCWGVWAFLRSEETDMIYYEARAFSQHCRYNAEINDEGIDISDIYYQHYFLK